MNSDITPLDSVLNTLLHTFKTDKPAVLAIVIQTWGSAPRPVGSMMMITPSFEIIGSVSGGCIENEVITDALTVLEENIPVCKSYGVSDALAWEQGLSCGGTIEALLIPLTKEWTILYPLFEHFIHNKAQRKATSLLFDLSDFSAYIIEENGHFPEILSDIVLKEHIFSASQKFTHAEKNWFSLAAPPSLHIIIVGAVHIAQCLTPIALACDYQVTIIDPREIFATPHRFPQGKLCIDWPEEVLPTLTIDHHTAIITLTHDIKLDKPTLEFALQSDAFYIGALGSQRTQSMRKSLLQKTGFSEEKINMIHGPIGLDIGAKGAGEIAVSILSEIIACWRKQSDPTFSKLLT